MVTQHARALAHDDQRQRALDKRLDDIGWGLFLAMIGTIWLVPEDRVPHGAWLIGTGLILLGLNVVRYLMGVPLKAFTTILGLAALVAGIGPLVGLEIPVLPLSLILIGIGLILRPLLRTAA